jgi:hypothetical protein
VWHKFYNFATLFVSKTTDEDAEQSADWTIFANQPNRESL